MSIRLNHTIVHSRDKVESAAFLVEILGLPAPAPFGPFLTVQMDNEVTLDFYDADREIAPQHYAFLVSGMEFDEILGRIPGSAGFRSGQILIIIGRTRSIPMTEGAELTLMTRVDIISRLLPGPMGAAYEPSSKIQ